MSGGIIAAVKSDDALKRAVSSGVRMIFDLLPSIETAAERAALCSVSGKDFFIHIDLAEGIGKDRAGLKFLKKCGVTGIISTRASLIKAAKEIGLKTVQRFFIIDSQSIKTAQTSLGVCPDMIEIMPGLIAGVISEISEFTSIPVIAGGLIKSRADVENAVRAGAFAVSTTKEELWQQTRKFEII